MVGRRSVLAYALLACCWHHTLAQDLLWRSNQASHRSLRLEKFGALESVARLDERLDPDGSVFSSLLNPILRSRFVGTQAHEDVRQHIVATLSALGWSVDGDRTFRMSTPFGEQPFTNVIATHDPRAPRRMVLACHYDSIYNRPNFVAATDSAVPCAMMLHLATLLTRDYLDPVKGKSDLTLQLIFFDGEEAFQRWSDSDSIYGSRHLARELQRAIYQRTAQGDLNDLDRIDIFVLLDLLGAANPRISNLISETNGEFRHLVAVERKLRSENLLQNVPNIFKFQRNWGFFGPPQVADDHLPFMRRGVRVLHLIPSPFPAVWHTDADDASAIHRPTVDNLSRILRVYVVEYLRLPEHLSAPSN